MHKRSDAWRTDDGATWDNETASIARLRHAREVVEVLAGVGVLLVMRGLLMPDTPGLAATGEHRY